VQKEAKQERKNSEHRTKSNQARALEGTNEKRMVLMREKENYDPNFELLYLCLENRSEHGEEGVVKVAGTQFPCYSGKDRGV
jgi:hypothetical protein